MPYQELNVVGPGFKIQPQQTQAQRHSPNTKNVALAHPRMTRQVIPREGSECRKKLNKYTA